MQQDEQRQAEAPPRIANFSGRACAPKGGISRTPTPPGGGGGEAGAWPGRPGWRSASAHATASRSSTRSLLPTPETRGAPFPVEGGRGQGAVFQPA